MMKCRKSGKRTAPSCCVRSHGVMNGRLAGSRSTEITKSRSESIVGRSRTPLASDIDLDLVAVQFHQLAPRRGLALAHQAGERVDRRGEAECAVLELQQPTPLWAQGRVPELL